MKFEDAVHAIPTGCYRHYKGNMYEVIGIARHSETKEPMVVYRALYGDGGLWVRPADMWNETVERGGNVYTRFCAIEMPKEQEPKVMTLEELRHAINVWVWMERRFDGFKCKPYNVEPQFHTKVDRDGNHFFTDRASMPEECYGDKWRCWTSCPSEKVRQETPWE